MGKNKSNKYVDPVIGKNLAELCFREDISARELADSCGRVKNTAYAWLYGMSSPNSSDLKRICERYHVSADDILGLKRKE